MSKQFKLSKKLLSSFFIGFAIVTKGVLAAPCCSTNAAAPSIISGDDRTQVTVLSSYSAVIGDAPDTGPAIFRPSSASEATFLYRLDVVQVIADRFQLGANIPMINRSVSRLGSSAQATGMGDLRVIGTYEILPEWNYSIWQPKGFSFLQLTIPTGKSIYEATQTGAVDATGQGFYTLALGSLFVKKWNVWDAYFIPEVHYSFSRSFISSDGSGLLTASPGFGTSLALGLGYNPTGTNLRFGLRLQPAWNQGTLAEADAGLNSSKPQQTRDVSLEASYFVSSEWTVFAAYTDQTLLGPAMNSALSRTIAVGLQHRWPR